MDSTKRPETPVGLNRQDEARGRAVEHADRLAHSTDQCEDRDHRDARMAIADTVQRRQDEFNIGVARALNRAAVFGQACARALGTISRDEAIDALKRDIGEELEKLR